MNIENPPHLVTLGDRIRGLRRELSELEQQQRDDLLDLVASAFPPGEVFSTSQLWQQPEVRAVCLDAGVATPQQLGLWLRQVQTVPSVRGLDRIGRNGDGIVWSVSADDLHDDPRLRRDDDV